MSNNENKNAAGEKKILAEEKEILREIKKEEKLLLGMQQHIIVGIILATLLIAGLAAGLIYWRAAQNEVYTDKAQISAPQIDLSPNTSGPLEDVFVNEGDEVPANTVVARVGDELIKTKIAGIVIGVDKNIGKLFNHGEPVVSMIDPGELRVVAQIEEDKGLKYISVGQEAAFTVDAFGSKKYFGTVDEISPTSRNTDVVFNISDKRQVNEFDVKIRFNTSEYPELKNGMSAKVRIYKQ